MPGTSPKLACYVFKDPSCSISSPLPRLRRPWQHLTRKSYCLYSEPKPPARAGFVCVRPMQSLKAPLTAILCINSLTLPLWNTWYPPNYIYLWICVHGCLCVTVRSDFDPCKVSPSLPWCALGINPWSDLAGNLFTWWDIPLVRYVLNKGVHISPLFLESITSLASPAWDTLQLLRTILWLAI